ncbi:MAG: SprT-like domain-containing protein [Chthonomonadaceae bacterium]|nr:SprT-like domain-containing protein [Chthonomonadaceae bacterium]
MELTAEVLLAELCAVHPLGYSPRIEWKNLRVTAGAAYYTKGVIGLSRLLLTDEARLRSTLVHEFAHLLAISRHGRKAAGHGEAWRKAMRDLGAEPEVYHRYPETKRNQRRQQVTYACAKCKAVITRSRRLPRKGRYVHAGCGGAIRVQGVVRLTARPPQTPLGDDA